MFPGLSAKLSDATCVLFLSGKVTILGAKCEIDVHSTVFELGILLGV